MSLTEPFTTTGFFAFLYLLDCLFVAAMVACVVVYERIAR